MANDVADWTTYVEVSGGTVNVTTTPTEPILAKITGDVTLTATTVTAIVTGPVSLHATTVVGVTSITNPVSINPEAGSTFTVEGKTGGVAVGIAGSIDIASGTVDVASVAGNVTVENVTNGVLRTGAALDFLASKVDTAITSSTVSVATITLTKVYSALLVIVDIRTPTTHQAYCAIASFPTASHPRPRWVSPFSLYPLDSANFFQTICPFANEPTDETNVTVYMSGIIKKATVWVYGMTQAPASLQLRSDGRAYPLGSMTATAVAAFSTHTFVVPAVPLRALVSSVAMMGETAGGPVCWMAYTQNGDARRRYLAPGSVTTKPSPVGVADFTGHGGLLCDPGTSVSVHSGASHSWVATLVYDLVV